MLGRDQLKRIDDIYLDTSEPVQAWLATHTRRAQHGDGTSELLLVRFLGLHRKTRSGVKAHRILTDEGVQDTLFGDT